MEDAVARGTRGAGVTLLGQAIKIALQFVSLVVLSRLLPPKDFGLVAMVTVFVTFGELVRDFGMSTIGLQRQRLSQQDASNLFWMSTALGAATGLILAVATPLLVAFYDEPRLRAVVPTLALTLVINGMAAQIRVQLARSMKYRALVVSEVSALVLALGVGVACALAGLDYWALVVQTLVMVTVTLALYWLLARWLPSWPRRIEGSRALFTDGAAFGIAQFLNYVAENADTVIIGARWDASALGVYNRAYQLLALPVSRLVAPLTQVVVPTVNGAIRQGREMDSILMRVQFALGTVVVLAFGTSGAIAPWLMPWLLGSEWTGSAPLFQILAIGGMVRIFSNVNYWRAVVGNLGKELAIFNVITKLGTVSLLFAASFVSLEAVAWAVTIGFVGTWPAALLWFHKRGQWNSGLYLREGLRVILPGALGFAAGVAVMSQFEQPGMLAAILGASAVLMVFGAGVMVVPGGASRVRSLGATAQLLRRAT